MAFATTSSFASKPAPFQFAVLPDTFRQFPLYPFASLLTVAGPRPENPSVPFSKPVTLSGSGVYPGSAVGRTGFSGVVGFSVGVTGFSVGVAGFSVGLIGFSVGLAGFSVGVTGFSVGVVGFSVGVVGFSVGFVGVSVGFTPVPPC